MNKIDSLLVGLAFLIFIGSGYLPTTIYIYSFSNMLVPFLLLVVVLVSMSYSRAGAVALALAVAGLFVEYRKRVMAGQPSQPLDVPQYEKQLAPAPPIVPDEVHPAFGEPGDETIGFKPVGDADGEFDGQAQSINEKDVFASQRFPEDTEKFLVSQGLV